VVRVTVDLVTHKDVARAVGKRSDRALEIERRVVAGRGHRLDLRRLDHPPRRPHPLAAYAGHADVGGQVRFEQVMPGPYLFELTTPLEDAIEATPLRVAVTARAGEVAEGKIVLEPLSHAAAEACGMRSLDKGTAVLAGRIALGSGDPAAKARVTVEWTGDERHTDTRDDGWFRICGVPTGTLLLVKASHGSELATSALTPDAAEIVHPLALRMTPCRTQCSQRSGDVRGAALPHCGGGGCSGGTADVLAAAALPRLDALRHLDGRSAQPRERRRRPRAGREAGSLDSNATGLGRRSAITLRLD
jgi:hypothetical protein